MTEIKINTEQRSTSASSGQKMGGENCCNCHCHRVPVTLRDTFFQDPFFSTSWDDFDKMRRDMIAETRLAWQKFDEEMKKFEEKSALTSSRKLNQDKLDHNATKTSFSEDKISFDEKTPPEVPERQIKIDDNRNFSNSWFSPRKLMRFPSLFGEDRNFVESTKNSFFKEDQNVIRVKDDDKAFEITMDTSQYRPDDLKVNVMNNTLTIEAKHSEQSEDGHSFVARQFLRKYSLPRRCRQERVNSNLSSDGVLVITAPKLAAISDNIERTVPILRN